MVSLITYLPLLLVYPGEKKHQTYSFFHFQQHNIKSPVQNFISSISRTVTLHFTHEQLKYRKI